MGTNRDLQCGLLLSTLRARCRVHAPVESKIERLNPSCHAWFMVHGSFSGGGGGGGRIPLARVMPGVDLPHDDLKVTPVTYTSYTPCQAASEPLVLHFVGSSGLWMQATRVLCRSSLCVLCVCAVILVLMVLWPRDCARDLFRPLRSLGSAARGGRHGR